MAGAGTGFSPPSSMPTTSSAAPLTLSSSSASARVAAARAAPARAGGSRELPAFGWGPRESLQEQREVDAPSETGSRASTASRRRNERRVQRVQAERRVAELQLQEIQALEHMELEALDEDVRSRASRREGRARRGLRSDPGPNISRRSSPAGIRIQAAQQNVYEHHVLEGDVTLGITAVQQNFIREGDLYTANVVQNVGASGANVRNIIESFEGRHPLKSVPPPSN